ncbi:hypothetical protein CRG98_025807 [Punica granatum]|uniref:Uncharacterized protein n=1 Tax=Punica granatum TaxID=22663 RepID=A0A2I0JC14_PUNGR|nr:hypothetical protein CRG98_025807 [Punica granatum]
MPRLYLPRPSPLPLSSAQSPPSSLVPPMADTIGDHFKAELKFTNVWEGIPRNPLLPFTSSERVVLKKHVFEEFASEQPEL